MVGGGDISGEIYTVHILKMVGKGKIGGYYNSLQNVKARNNT